MSFYTKLIAAVAALGLATSVFAADEAATQQSPAADTTAATAPAAPAKAITEAKADQADAKAAPAATTQVNLNTASAEDLAKVNGLNKKKAEMIVKYRTDNGNFTTVEDLKKIKGLNLSAKQMKKVKSQLTIG